MTSKQPRKQRRAVMERSLHLRSKAMSITLSKELRKRFGKRNVKPRKGDEVRVMRGKYAGKAGKITHADRTTYRVGVEGITHKRKDGKEKPIFLQCSNLMIMSLDEKDKLRGLAQEKK